MKLTRTFFATVCSLLIASAAQAEKPRLMVMPDNPWMNQNNYVQQEEFQGKTKKKYLYDDAFNNDRELFNVVTAVGEVFANRQFPLASYQAQMENKDDADSNMEFTDDFEEEAEDVAAGNRKQDLADIRIEIGWNREIDNSVTFRMRAVDAFSTKEVCATKYDGIAVSRITPLARALQLAVDTNMDTFMGQLESHFADIQTNGRETALICRVKKGSPVNFETEMSNGETLGMNIYNWLNDNSVNHQFSQRAATKNKLEYDQIRMSMKDSAGRQQIMQTYISGLVKYLKNTFNVRATTRDNAPGSCVLVIEG